VSLLRSTVIPGQGAPLHTHAYDEVFVIHRGHGRYTVEGESVEATEGDIVVVPAGLRHAYVSVGPEALQQTSVHRNSVFAQTLMVAPDVGRSEDR
jgi:quercetin dioxygenase-like cupin family protein